MCARYLGFVLLVWFPGVLRAQSAAQPCVAPSLRGGYFVPEQDTYAHDTTLTYACDDRLKPAVEGWWAQSTCQNGKWSHEPRCINKLACIPPEIPNAKRTENQNGWYEDGRRMTVTCNEGYEAKARGNTVECINGKWSSVPVCEKSIQACGEPPKIPHAVIIHQRYQEVFAVGSEVQYECEDGFTVEGADSRKTVRCITGNWTPGPTCRTGPDTGHGGSTVGGTSGGHTTSAGRGTQPVGGGTGTGPGTGHGGSTVGGTSGGHTNMAGRETQPTGSSTTSGLNDRDSRPQTVSIDHCGSYPIIPNGDAVPQSEMLLKYQCNSFYKLVGSDTVKCHSDGQWSHVPTCKEAFCIVDLAQHARFNFKQTGLEYVKEGETKWFLCTWQDFYRVFQCTNGRLYHTECCHRYDYPRGICPFSPA